MNRYLPTVVAALLADPLVSSATAACLTDEQVAALTAAYEARQPASNPVGLTAEDARCSRAKFNALLQAKYGEPVGYKAGLTSRAVQERFNYPAPVRGTLYAPMLLPSNAVVPAAFGARPVFEADLLVRVSSAAINQATTPAEVLQAIDQVIPFIELPDLMVANPAQLDGAGIIAINAGSRLGVMGTPLVVSDNPGLLEALRTMQVIVRGNGVELDRGEGSAILDHPLNAVLWLAADLARDGIALQPGDLLGLGSFSKLLPPQPGLAVEVQYQGLPGNPRVSVSFR